MNRAKTISIILTSLFLSASPYSPALAESSEILQQAITEYRNGNYDKALALMAEDLKKNPNDGVTHYYIGLLKKQHGEDAEALDQLELAVRLCPPEIIDKLTKRVAVLNDGEIPDIPKATQTAAKQGDWMAQLQSGFAGMFGGANNWQWPEFLKPVEKMLGQGKKTAGRDGHRYVSTASKTMPMHEMLALVDKSKAINASEWASHKEGLSKFTQSPPDSQGWDYWIRRFKRSFQHVLMTYLANDASNQVTGSAACIFSLDKDGNLRGHIYASTGDRVLNKALVKTIRKLDHSRVLKFPSNARISGFNFRMTWDFGKMLAYIRYTRAYRKAIAERLKALELEAAKKKTEAELLKAKEKNQKVMASKTAQAKPKKATPSVREPEVKTEVSAKLMPLEELKARALRLPDLPFSEKPITTSGDVFKDIDDSKIMRWPDVSR